MLPVAAFAQLDHELKSSPDDYLSFKIPESEPTPGATPFDYDKHDREVARRFNKSKEDPESVRRELEKRLFKVEGYLELEKARNSDMEKIHQESYKSLKDAYEGLKQSYQELHAFMVQHLEEDRSAMRAGNLSQEDYQKTILELRQRLSASESDLEDHEKELKRAKNRIFSQQAEADRKQTESSAKERAREAEDLYNHRDR